MTKIKRVLVCNQRLTTSKEVHMKGVENFMLKSVTEVVQTLSGLPKLLIKDDAEYLWRSAV